MIIKIGNLFNSQAETLVNTVNCVGVMGKGLALEFKKRYPDMFADYKQKCAAGLVKPGVPYLFSSKNGISIINFPTKDHWRSPSRYSYIVKGLDFFLSHYREWGIKSIAFPPLGCGNGGLEWKDVGPLMYSKLSDLPIAIEIYAPYGTNPEMISEKYLRSHVAEAEKDILGKSNTTINKYWYLILHIIRILNQDKYSLNVGRTIFQKICYVLTRTGIPTGFHFSEGTYGPYSPEVKEAIAALSNANLMRERQMGKMVETVVSPEFELDRQAFTQDELKKTDDAVDLLSRIKNTDQAEMVSTVLFTYDELMERTPYVTEGAIFRHIHEWKSWWKDTKDKEIIETIENLALLGWIRPDRSQETMVCDDTDLF